MNDSPQNNSPNNSDPFEDPEFRSHVKGAILSIIILTLVLIACGVMFEPELKSIGKMAYELMGIPGLSLLVLIGDSIITPIPPDIALMVVQQSDLSENAGWIVTWLGICSVCAGFLGWYLGHKLHDTSFPKRIFGNKLESAERLMKKFGPFAVGIGAMTPIPYSVTTWTAGMFDVSAKKMIIPTLLRIPRLWIYYWVLEGAFKISELLG